MWRFTSCFTINPRLGYFGWTLLPYQGILFYHKYVIIIHRNFRFLFSSFFSSKIKFQIFQIQNKKYPQYFLSVATHCVINCIFFFQFYFKKFHALFLHLFFLRSSEMSQALTLCHSDRCCHFWVICARLH